MDILFNKDWTQEEAWEAEVIYTANGGAILSINSPATRWHALKRIDGYQIRYDEGEKFVLLLSIGICAEFNFIMPEWVADAYLKSLDPILRYQCNDLNEAFGSPTPKGTNIQATRKKYELEGLVYLYARDAILKDPQRTIDAGLYDEIGKKFHISKTTVQEYCKSVIKKGCVPLSEVKRNIDSPRYQILKKLRLT